MLQTATISSKSHTSKGHSPPATNTNRLLYLLFQTLSTVLKSDISLRLVRHWLCHDCLQLFMGHEGVLLLFIVMGSSATAIAKLALR